MDYQDKNTDEKKSVWHFRLCKDANSMWNELSDEEKSLYDGYEDFYENYIEIKKYAKILSIPVTFLMVVVVRKRSNPCTCKYPEKFDITVIIQLHKLSSKLIVPFFEYIL